MRGDWTEEHISILRDRFPEADLNELAKSLNKTKTAVRTKATKLGIHRSPEVRPWSEQKVKLLLNLYPNHANAEIGEILGMSESSVSAKAFKLKLFKTEEFHKDRREKGYYKKGDIPYNKGRRQTEYMSVEAIERTKATRFQKGHTPSNHKPIGYERTDTDGYVYVKTEEPNVFKLKHRILWEQHYGPIPKGYNIQFKDKNPKNIRIENLYIISKDKQLKFENSLYVRYPEPVQKLIQIVITII